MPAPAAAATAMPQEAQPCEVALQEDVGKDIPSPHFLIAAINTELDRRKTAFWWLGLLPTRVYMKRLGPFPEQQESPGRAGEECRSCVTLGKSLPWSLHL